MARSEMYDYWKKQPEALKGILEQRKSLVAEFVRLVRETAPDRIYMIGSGTSFNAESAAAPFMEKLLGIEVSVIPSSRIPKIFSQRPLMVFISQGGSSTNTLAAMDSLKQFPHIAITGEAECEMKNRSLRHMLIGCGEELAGPKTMGYTSSVMCFYVSALEAGLSCGTINRDNYNKYIETLELAESNMTENLKRADAWFERNIDDLKEIRKYVIVGKGLAGAAAMEGALKILETVRIPVIGYEFEEYLHGPILMTDKEMGGIFFITEDPADKPRMLRLAQCHEQFSRHTYRITCDESIDGDGTLHILSTEKSFTEVFEFVLVPQLMGARIPGLLGLSDGKEIFKFFASQLATKYGDGR